MINGTFFELGLFRVSQSQLCMCFVTLDWDWLALCMFDCDQLTFHRFDCDRLALKDPNLKTVPFRLLCSLTFSICLEQCCSKCGLHNKIWDCRNFNKCFNSYSQFIYLYIQDCKNIFSCKRGRQVEKSEKRWFRCPLSMQN